MGKDNHLDLSPDLVAHASSGDSLIHASGISKSYTHSESHIVILDELTFQLQSGETLGIVGASGIGKSTLLHILGTLDRPNRGLLKYSGKNVLELDDAQLARFRNRMIGFVFQFHHLLPEFSALENTMMPALIGGMGKKTAKDAAEAILVRVGLRDRLTHRAGELSGGEQQRVALARALVKKPEILFADEPTGNLDSKNGKAVLEMLLEMRKEQGATLVLVTHSREIAALADRTVQLEDGRVL